MTVIIIILLVVIALMQYELILHEKLLIRTYRALENQQTINRNVSKRMDADKIILTEASNNAYSAKMGTESVRSVIDKVYHDVHKFCSEENDNAGK